MFQQYFRDSEWLSLPLIALVFFFVFFLVVLARVVFGMRDARRVDELAALPFGADPADASEERPRHE
ncbi:MAG: hypothetical protein JNK02_13125 [Planctomycetes bacterium]|nr:hypothetical protein [Planctomycetota bacterium]